MKILRQCQDKQQWNDFVINNGGHPFQLWGWGELKSLHGWIATRLYFLDDETDEIFGGVQVIIRDMPIPFKSLAYIPRGPIIDEANRFEMLDCLAKYIKSTYGSLALSIEPDYEEYSVPEGWVKSKNHILPPRTVQLDLTCGESDLLAKMAKKTRQYIRKSAAEDIKIRKIKGREDLKKCLDIYHETNRRAKFSIHSDQYYYDAYFRLEENGQVFAVYHQDEPIAFLWLAITADIAYELYGGVTELGQELRVNYALKWHAIRKCKEWGLKKYDFGGLIEGGVENFKMGWTDKETNLAGTFDKPLSISYKLWASLLPKGKKILQKIEAIFK